MMCLLKLSLDFDQIVILIVTSFLKRFKRDIRGTCSFTVVDGAQSIFSSFLFIILRFLENASE
jgi:hypothetical protein